MSLRVYKCRSKGALLLCTILIVYNDGLAYVTPGIITGAVSRDLDCTEGFVTFCGGLQIAIITAIGPIAAVQVKRFGMKTLGTVIGFSSFCALYLLSIASDKFMLGVAMCLQGLSVGMLFTSTFVVTAQVFPNSLSQVNAILLTSGTVGTASAPLLQILVDLYGWRGAIKILAALQLHISVLSLLLKSNVGRSESDIQETNTEHIVSTNSIFKILHLDVFIGNFRLTAIFLSGMWAGFTTTLFYLFLVPYAIRCGISYFDASVLKTASLLPTIFIRIFVLCCGDTNIIQILGLFLVAQVFQLITLYILAYYQSFSMLYFGSTIYGLSYGIQFHAVYTLAAKFVDNEEDKGYAVSWIIFSEGMGSILVAIIGVTLNNYDTGFQIGFYTEFVVILLVVHMIIQHRRTSAMT